MTAHAHEQLFVSLPSKFGHYRPIRRAKFPKKQGYYFIDQDTFSGVLIIFCLAVFLLPA